MIPTALIRQGITLAQRSHSGRDLADGFRFQALFVIHQWQAAEQALETALRVETSMLYLYGDAKTQAVYGLLHQVKSERLYATRRTRSPNWTASQPLTPPA